MGDAFDCDRADDAEEQRAVEPVETHRLRTMDGNRDRIKIGREPTVEGKSCFHTRAAFAQAAAYSLHARVRAVEMDAVTVADNEAVDRIDHIFVKDNPHAKLDLLTRFDDRD